MHLVEWLVHYAPKLVLRVRCSTRSSLMMHVYVTNIETDIMWLKKCLKLVRESSTEIEDFTKVR